MAAESGPIAGWLWKRAPRSTDKDEDRRRGSSHSSLTQHSARKVVNLLGNLSSSHKSLYKQV